MGSNRAGLNHQQGCWPINKPWGYYRIIEREYYWIYICIHVYNELTKHDLRVSKNGDSHGTAIYMLGNI